ncbi:MAG TPA: ThiF family adenylyltransferase [Solirubrobacteraceae bacterium]|nr:ThiF family adenylyltransferase [Solirubrobacteraceae bacterium]
MGTPEYFARITGSVNFPLLQSKRVVVVGVGMVGSQIAEELAKCGVGYLRFIDHDTLESANLSRHALDDDFLNWNKAEGLTVYLATHVRGVRAEAVPHKINSSISDDLLDQWLADADLIVAATDDDNVQRRVARRALALGIRGIFPSLYPGVGGGEVIIQFDRQVPCFSCWDEFRENDAPLRGATALNVAALPIIFVSLRICLGLLDTRSADREMMVAGVNRPPYQSFVLNRFGTLRSGHLTRRPNCLVCGGSTLRFALTPAPDVPAPLTMSPAGIRSAIGWLLVVALAIAPIGGMAAILEGSSDPNNPDFGTAILGFLCAVGILVDIGAILALFVAVFKAGVDEDRNRAQ